MYYKPKMVPESYEDKHLNGGVQKHVETAKNVCFFVTPILLRFFGTHI